MSAKQEDPRDALREIEKLLKKVEADDHTSEVKEIDKVLAAVTALKKDVEAVDEE